MILFSFIPYPQYTLSISLLFKHSYVILVRSIFNVYIIINKHYSELNHDAIHDFFPFLNIFAIPLELIKSLPFLPLFFFNVLSNTNPSFSVQYLDLFSRHSYTSGFQTFYFQLILMWTGYSPSLVHRWHLGTAFTITWRFPSPFSCFLYLLSHSNLVFSIVLMVFIPQ